MQYKGYYGVVEYSDEDKCFLGKVIGISDLISFEGKSVTGLKTDFQGAINDYISLCERQGKEPQKAYKGSFNVRVTPDLHMEAVAYSERHGMTLNAFVEKAILIAMTTDNEL